MNGKELYAWTQRELACLREKRELGYITWGQYTAARKEIDGKWAQFRKSRDNEREMKHPTLKVGPKHYEKSFMLSELPPDQEAFLASRKRA